MSSPSRVIPGPCGELQAQLECRAEAPAFAGLVAHPHPLHGGTMDNKVVTTLSRLVRDQGGAALRFNFRGVGASRGQFDNGVGEQDDVLAAVDWLHLHYPQQPLWLAGFSFGSYAAAAAAQRLAEASAPVAGLFLVAPPVHHYPFDRLEHVAAPVTVIQGDEDEVVPAEAVHDWAAASPLRPQLLRLADCGHFFHGRLAELKAAAQATLPA